MKTKKGILLVNLGTPDAPRAPEVAAYLRQFLMDPLVIDIPWPLRWFLVNVLIVPKRSHASAEAYQKVWTTRGSPLLFHSVDLASKLQKEIGDTAVVRLGMRYGKPSIGAAIEELLAAGIEEITAIPLYPQYSLAATESSVVEIERCLKGRARLSIIPEFFDHPAFISAFSKVSRDAISKDDFVLFSFHGLPERHDKKSIDAGRGSYREQCFATAKALAEKMGLSKEKYEVGFQSRLGRTPWIKPYTDEFYKTLPSKGVRKLVVISPSFVADCLETIEEIDMRGREDFLKSGGEQFKYVPSLNSHDAWVQALKEIVC